MFLRTPADRGETPVLPEHDRHGFPAAFALPSSDEGSVKGPRAVILAEFRDLLRDAPGLGNGRIRDAEIILADNGIPTRMEGTFDIFVGNPPYYSDYRIADVFLETARRALKPGGVCYTVCKNAAGLEPVQRRYFPDVKIVKRRGYAVLKSVKEDVQ